MFSNEGEDEEMCELCTENPVPAVHCCAWCEAPLCEDHALPAEYSSYWRGLPPGTFYCEGTDHDRLEAGEED